MGKYSFPRKGTAAANVLATLHKAGAPVSVARLLARSGSKRGFTQFNDEVVGLLCVRGLARATPAGIEITNEGCNYVNRQSANEPALEGIPAAPRVARGFRPLQSRSPMVIRDGAMDYRDIPSMMGGVRYDYVTGAQLVDA